MGPCTPSSRGPAPALWTPGGPRGRAEGPRVEEVGGLGRGEELLAEASLRCWSKGLGGEGEGRTEKVLLRGMGEPGGKTTWEKEERERDEGNGGGNISSASRGSLGPSHSDTKSEAGLTRPRDAEPPPPHAKLPLWLLLGKNWRTSALAQPWAATHYLLYQLPPSPPPTRLHSDDDALGQPVLGRGPRGPLGLLHLRLDAQPTLQLRDEPLLGRGPAQGGGVQPATRGGLPGHGVSVAGLPAPSDHGADLGGGGGKLSQATLGSADAAQSTLESPQEGWAGPNHQRRAKLS